MIIARHPVTTHCVHPGVVRTNTSGETEGSIASQHATGALSA